MSNIDWNLIIGYPLTEALEYINDENENYVIIKTAAPRKQDKTNTANIDEFRIVGVRNQSDTVELICAVEDWCIS